MKTRILFVVIVLSLFFAQNAYAGACDSSVNCNAKGANCYTVDSPINLFCQEVQPGSRAVGCVERLTIGRADKCQHPKEQLLSK